MIKLDLIACLKFMLAARGYTISSYAHRINLSAQGFHSALKKGSFMLLKDIVTVGNDLDYKTEIYLKIYESQNSADSIFCEGNLDTIDLSECLKTMFKYKKITVASYARRKNISRQGYYRLLNNEKFRLLKNFVTISRDIGFDVSIHITISDNLAGAGAGIVFREGVLDV